MMAYTIHRENELKHYGVPGSKWGVRRYQNLDGSYKPGAEGRYYQAIGDAMKRRMAFAKSVSDKHAQAKTALKTLMGSKKDASGGGAVKTAERPINKTINGKDIDVRPVSEKRSTEKSDEKKSSKKKSSSADEGTAEFKVSQLQDKIENLFDVDDMTDEDWENMELSDSDIDELDDLITKYRQWRGSNKSNTKKLKKIDEFIDRYEAWKSSHSKHSEPKEVYLKHSGILGMKWGIRRYQNEDGTYTTLGKLRRKLKGEDRDPDYNRAHGKEKIQYLSTEELKARNDRLNTENNYLRNRQQNDELRTPKAVKEADDRRKKLIQKIVIDPLTDYAANEMKKHLPDMINAGKEYYNKRRSK